MEKWSGHWIPTARRAAIFGSFDDVNSDKGTKLLVAPAAYDCREVQMVRDELSLFHGRRSAND